MVNGLGVLGWGVGGIEAEAAMLGQPVSMLIPQVVGFKLSGVDPDRRDGDGCRAHDHRSSCASTAWSASSSSSTATASPQVPLANRATIGNMSPEFGSTAAMFPIDDVTLDYLRLTGRSEEQVALVEAYSKLQKPLARPERSSRSSASTSSSTSAPSCRRSPARSARRTASS